MHKGLIWLKRFCLRTLYIFVKEPGYYCETSLWTQQRCSERKSFYNSDDNYTYGSIVIIAYLFITELCHAYNTHTHTYMSQNTHSTSTRVTSGAATSVLYAPLAGADMGAAIELATFARALSSGPLFLMGWMHLVNSQRPADWILAVQ